MNNSTRPWHIHDQCWSRLNIGPNEDPRPFLNRNGQAAIDRDDSAGSQHGWTPIARETMLPNLSRNGQPSHPLRIVLTGEACFGKTVATQWFEYELNHPDHLGRQLMAFRFEVGALLEGVRSGTIKSHVMTRLFEQWKATVESRQPQLSEQMLSEMKRQLDSHARRGSLVLILDGLDQSNRVEEMGTLLSEFPDCQFIVAGRQHSIVANYEALFRRSEWTFVRLNEFTREQQIRFLGWMPEGKSLRYYEIPSEARDLLRVPGVLSFCQRTNNFSSSRTLSDIFYHSMKSQLQDSARLREEYNDRGAEVAMKFLAILAFESLVHHQRGSEPDRTLPYLYDLSKDDVGANEFSDIQAEIEAKCKQEGINGLETWDKVQHLGAEFIELGVFEDSQWHSQIVWRERVIHEFFLAYYFSCLAKEEDFDLLSRWVPCRNRPETDAYHQFWRFLCEMHKDVRIGDVWLSAIAPLFRRPAITPNGDGRRRGRPTEMIVRALRTLREYASANSREMDRSRAQQVLATWHHEFRDAQVDEDRSRRAAALSLLWQQEPDKDSQFIPVEMPQGAGGRPFALHRFCVTNEQFELFDPSHVDFRESRENDHPVVNVTLFDALCFAEWINIVELDHVAHSVILPTGGQWECACRCGETTAYTWRSRANGDTIRSPYCHCDFAYHGKVVEGMLPQGTIRVDGTHPLISVAPNPWGFHQMHGNVWELCVDQRDPWSYDVELRGGSFNSAPESCASSNAGCIEPNGYRHDVGFRLAVIATYENEGPLEA
ncbi:MAG: formylglycine-generating enzyme family protein [Planctomycetales bacterium]|nr:formylglycine-generating enzyme family protein [Planctomycetales bacterium]